MSDTNPVPLSIEERVKEVLEMFRSTLQADGGDIEFISVDEQMRVHLKLVGACGSCPMATMELKMGIQSYIMDAVPEITEVVNDAPQSSEGMDSYFY